MAELIEFSDDKDFMFAGEIRIIISK